MLIPFCYLLILLDIALLQEQSSPAPQPPPVQQPTSGQQPSAGRKVPKFGDEEAIHDKEHLKQHLENKIDINEEWDAEKESFHYFSMSDLNKDQRIDGLEIIKAATHEHDGNMESLPPLDENALEKLVDTVLNEMDVNGDGLIDFVEYTIRQKRKT
ncbi:Multiple coagulation factor deficiency protein 2 -like protein [Toxocara canis]|uniref:Multiple coagulation factor deficiency protein 2-like protein n=1 Tax=Toxocara canis TaxID=6265 RepID=A0A0B2VIW8_TOXCA|nr:Multiple coagulation factor deficiency protein 2 -like protein [Toxocara canis]